MGGTADGEKLGYALHGTHKDALQDRHEIPPGTNRTLSQGNRVEGLRDGGSGSTALRTRSTDSSYTLLPDRFSMLISVMRPSFLTLIVTIVSSSFFAVPGTFQAFFIFS
jgi:hypothetical protein